MVSAYNHSLLIFPFKSFRVNRLVRILLKGSSDCKDNESNVKESFKTPKAIRMVNSVAKAPTEVIVVRANRIIHHWIRKTYKHRFQSLVWIM